VPATELIHLSITNILCKCFLIYLLSNGKNAKDTRANNKDIHSTTFYYGDCLCLWYVDRGSIIRVIWELPKANLINNGINFMMGISLTISGLLPPNRFVVFVVCCAIMGLSVPFYSGVQTALFQEKIKPEYLGRVFSLTGSIMSLAMPIGLILSGFFADRIGVNHWFFNIRYFNHRHCYSLPDDD
jgi:hypothetical protein